MVSNTQDIVLEIKGLKTNFYTYEGVVKALDGVELFLRRGDTMGLVGETGCGKSVTARSILRLVEPPGKIDEGQILFNHINSETGEIETVDIMEMSDKEVLDTRGASIAIVFQDPATYPNPVFRIGEQIAEVIMLHQDLSTDVLDMKIEKLEDERDSLTDENRKVKDQLAELKQKRKMEDEDIRHLVKIKESKLDIDHQKKQVELERAQQETIAKVKDEYRDKLEKELQRISGKLQNEKFLSNAPDEIVAKERGKQEEIQARLDKNSESTTRFKKLL